MAPPAPCPTTSPAPGNVSVPGESHRPGCASTPTPAPIGARPRRSPGPTVLGPVTVGENHVGGGAGDAFLVVEAVLAVLMSRSTVWSAAHRDHRVDHLTNLPTSLTWNRAPGHRGPATVARSPARLRCVLNVEDDQIPARRWSSCPSRRSPWPQCRGATACWRGRSWNTYDVISHTTAQFGLRGRTERPEALCWPTRRTSSMSRRHRRHIALWFLRQASSSPKVVNVL